MESELPNNFVGAERHAREVLLSADSEVVGRCHVIPAIVVLILYYNGNSLGIIVTS